MKLIYYIKLIKDYLTKNKKWLFSGFGTLLLGMLIGHCSGFFDRFFKIRDPQEKTVSAIPTPPQKLSKSPPETISRPVTNLPPETLSTREISEALNMAPVLQQPEIAKSYIGLKVICEGYLMEVTKLDNNNIGISMTTSGFHNANFKVNLKDYPRLVLLKRGTPIKVEGIIRKVNMLWIDIDEVKIISY
jgi:hypothetical protein